MIQSRLAAPTLAVMLLGDASACFTLEKFFVDFIVVHVEFIIRESAFNHLHAQCQFENTGARAMNKSFPFA